MSSADSVCKQFGPRSGPTERRSRSGPKPFIPEIIFLKRLILKKKSADDNKSMKKIPSMQRVKASFKRAAFDKQCDYLKIFHEKRTCHFPRIICQQMILILYQSWFLNTVATFEKCRLCKILVVSRLIIKSTWVKVFRIIP